MEPNLSNEKQLKLNSSLFYLEYSAVAWQAAALLSYSKEINRTSDRQLQITHVELKLYSNACSKPTYPPRIGQMKQANPAKRGNYKAINKLDYPNKLNKLNKPPFIISSTFTIFNCLMNFECFAGVSSLVKPSATI